MRIETCTYLPERRSDNKLDEVDTVIRDTPLFVKLLYPEAKVNTTDVRYEYFQGDLCGIEGSNFLDDNFTGTIAVAGEGCVSQPTTPTVYAHRTLMILEACPGSLFNVTVKFYSAQRTAKFVPTRYQ